MGIKLLLVGGASVLLTHVAMADMPSSAASGFASDAQGWSAENGAVSFAWKMYGGDPGGHVSAMDDPTLDDHLWFFSAPAIFLGNKAQAYDGTLSFSLESSSNSAPNTAKSAIVQLLGYNGVLLAYAGDAPGTDWTRYRLSLSADDGSWKVGSVNGPAASKQDISDVLGSLRALRISGDYFLGRETTALDSVVLAVPSVPEPASTLLWAAGGLTLFAVARRRRPLPD